MRLHRGCRFPRNPVQNALRSPHSSASEPPGRIQSLGDLINVLSLVLQEAAKDLARTPQLTVPCGHYPRPILGAHGPQPLAGIFTHQRQPVEDISLFLSLTSTPTYFPPILDFSLIQFQP